MATTPAKTPGPMIAIRSSAQISELIERVDTITSSARGRRNRCEGVVFRAARKATGTAMHRAINVPSVAMFSVSHRGRPSCVMYSQRGGVARVQMSFAMRGASETKNHVVAFDICCQHQRKAAAPMSHMPQCSRASVLFRRRQT